MSFDYLDYFYEDNPLKYIYIIFAQSMFFLVLEFLHLSHQKRQLSEPEAAACML